MDDLGKTSRVKGNRPKYKLLLFFLLTPLDFIVDIHHFFWKSPSHAIGAQTHFLYPISIAVIIGFAVQVIQNTHKISKHGLDTVIERFVNIAIHVGEFNAAFDVEEHQLGSVNLYAQKSKQEAKEKSRYAMEESPRATSRCFMFMYFLLPH